ncbi:MAG: NADAR family protein [Ruminococcus flavefaciens]|nr:NADAR family protein [Ruminococcus flavefaciens]
MYRGLEYSSVEAAFQSMKTLDYDQRVKFCHYTPTIAKRVGRHIALRDDWDQIRDAVMWTCLVQKFEQHPDLVEKLIGTKTNMIIEGNSWGDCYWGVCNGVGENRLGYMLMQIRNYYQGNNVEYDRKLLRSLACL